METDDVAAISINSFEYWVKNQINEGAKRAIKKAKKLGVACKVVPFNDELVRGIEGIFNETPVRQGRPFIHYGKTFTEIKEEFSKDLQSCDFIGAYYNEELIGFIKLAYANQYAVPFGMVSKLQHRDKAPQNALIAKAIEECALKKIDYFLYGKWTIGSLGDFKRHNGCELVRLPKYYVPLTMKGKIALKLRLHHGLLDLLPESFKKVLQDIRTKYYRRQSGIRNVIEREIV